MKNLFCRKKHPSPHNNDPKYQLHSKEETTKKRESIVVSVASELRPQSSAPQQPSTPPTNTNTATDDDTANASPAAENIDTNAMKVILDTDPGGDDVLAIAWLAAIQKAGHCEFAAITACEGNASSPDTYVNCQRIRSVFQLGDKIPIGRGVVTGKKSDGFNGADGLAGTSKFLPPVGKKDTPWKSAPWSDDLIIEVLEREEPHTVTIIAVGPLQNLASAEKKKPGILRRARDIAIMGGAFFVEGNVTPVSEFNIWFNPEALQTVLAARNDVMILPVDVTTKILFGREHLGLIKRFLTPGPNDPFFEQLDGNRMIEEGNSDLSRKVAPGAQAIWDFVNAILAVQVRQSLRFRQCEGNPAMVLHDSAAVAAIFYPEHFTFMKAHVQVDTQSELSFGNTIIDKRSTLRKSPPNAYVAVGTNGHLVASMFVEDFTGYIDSFR